LSNEKYFVLHAPGQTGKTSCLPALMKYRDSVAPVKRSDAAPYKVHSKKLGDGTQVHGFLTLLKLMSQIVRNKCRVRSAAPSWINIWNFDHSKRETTDCLRFA